ncbi:MAG: hypothetical protein QW435_02425 [Candidatus Hadarchaeales archaeon]
MGKGVGRPPKPVVVGCLPHLRRLHPFPLCGGDPISLEVAEVEALRLTELEKLPRGGGKENGGLQKHGLEAGGGRQGKSWRGRWWREGE